MYLLKELKVDYLSFVVITTTVTLVTLLTLPKWGKHIDKVGNISVIKFCGFIVSFIPILWIFSTYRFYFILVNALAGFAWAGFNLAVSNFIFDAVSEAKRVRCLSYFNLLNGLVVYLGAISGGFVAPHLPKIKGSYLLSIFLVSEILRFLIWRIFVRKIKEVRSCLPVNSKDLFFSNIGIRSIITDSQKPINFE